MFLQDKSFSFIQVHKSKKNLLSALVLQRETTEKTTKNIPLPVL